MEITQRHRAVLGNWVTYLEDGRDIPAGESKKWKQNQSFEAAKTMLAEADIAFVPNNNTRTITLGEEVAVDRGELSNSLTPEKKASLLRSDWRQSGRDKVSKTFGYGDRQSADIPPGFDIDQAVKLLQTAGVSFKREGMRLSLAPEDLEKAQKFHDVPKRDRERSS